MEKLYRLRSFFIIYFIVKIIIDIVFSSDISLPARNHIEISPTVFYVIAIIINIFLFLIGLLLFYFLLEKRNWARILLLIVGCLAILDFVSSIFLSSQLGDLFVNFEGITNWDKLIMIDRIKDFIGVIFWGYAIYVLQFNNDIKRIFFSETKTNMIDQRSV
jgi:hypothetical protein